MDEDELRTGVMADEPDFDPCLRYVLDVTLKDDESRNVPESDCDQGVIEIRCGTTIFADFRTKAEGVKLGIRIEFTED